MCIRDRVNSLLYAIAMSENVSSNEVPFRIIKKIIGNTGGVVMDSCGNYLFRERPNTVRIFMHADKNKMCIRDSRKDVFRCI